MFMDRGAEVSSAQRGQLLGLKALGAMAVVGLMSFVLIVPFGAGGIGSSRVARRGAVDPGSTIRLRVRRCERGRLLSPRSSTASPWRVAFLVGQLWSL